MNTWTKHKRTFLHSCAALWCYIQASSLSGRSPVKWLLNLMSVCIVLQMSWSHSNQIPAVPQSTTGRRIWSHLSVETQNPNDSSLSILPQSFSLIWSHLSASLQMTEERRCNQGRSFCSFLFLATRDSLQERAGLVRKQKCPFVVSAFLIDDLVYGCLLVPWSGDNVLVIHGYITAQHRGRLFRLETKKKKENIDNKYAPLLS